MTETMRAMALTGHGGLEKYEWREDWPRPEPGETEVLIRIGACGLNNTDVNTRTGWYAKSVDGPTGGGAACEDESGGWGGSAIRFPRIQGADAVGEVVAAGPRADAGLVGRRVLVEGWQRDWDDPENRAAAGYFGSEMDGGFAEYAAVDHRGVVPVDSALSDAELATFSCSYVTAEGMLARAEVGEGDTLLVTGASGGVGGALIQLAKLRGARVIAMASEAKHAAMRDLGADRLLPRALEDASALDGETVTVLADVVGGPGWPGLIETLAPGGRYVCSGAIAGPTVPLDLRTLYLRDLSFFGSTVTPPETLRRVVGHIESGGLRPILAATYPLRELAAAQQAFMDKRHVGAIVVTP